MNFLARCFSAALILPKTRKESRWIRHHRITGIRVCSLSAANKDSASGEKSEQQRNKAQPET